MLSLYDEATTHAALALPLDPKLLDLLAIRIAHHAAAGLTDMTHYLVIQPGDTEADIEREVGFYPAINAIDGTRFGSDTFQPSWDWLQHHDGWIEMVMTVGNGGFAFVLLIKDADGVDPTLLALCHHYIIERNKL